MNRKQEAGPEETLRAFVAAARETDLTPARIRATQAEARRLLAEVPLPVWEGAGPWPLPRLALAASLAAGLLLAVVWSFWPRGAGVAVLARGDTPATVPVAAPPGHLSALVLDGALQAVDAELRAFRRRYEVDGGMHDRVQPHGLWRELGEASQQLQDRLRNLGGVDGASGAADRPI